MVQKQLSLKDLEKAVKIERAKAKTSAQRAELQKELKQLRAGTSTKLLKRLGRGFGVLAKKGAKATGKGIKEARKFAEESGAERGLDTGFGIRGGKVRRPVSRGTVRKTVRVVKVRRPKGKRKVVRITKVIRTKRPVRRTRTPRSSDGFSGDFGLVDF